MLELLKNLLGIQGDEQDVTLQFALDDVKDIVLNYCNIRTLPQQLESTVIRMAIDIWRMENLGADSLDSTVTSIKEGDTTVNFQTIGNSNAYVQSVLKDYRVQLNRFRRVGR